MAPEMLHGVDHAADDHLMTSTSQGPQPHDNVVLSTVVVELLVTHTALVVSSHGLQLLPYVWGAAMSAPLDLYCMLLIGRTGGGCIHHH